MEGRVVSQPLKYLAKQVSIFPRVTERSRAKAQQRSMYALIPSEYLLRRIPKFSTRSYISPPSPQDVSIIRSHVQRCRTLSTSPVSKATIITANPRKDEDGNEMLIEITTGAGNVGPKFVASFLPLY